MHNNPAIQISCAFALLATIADVEKELGEAAHYAAQEAAKKPGLRMSELKTLLARLQDADKKLKAAMNHVDENLQGCYEVYDRNEELGQKHAFDPVIQPITDENGYVI